MPFTPQETAATCRGETRRRHAGTLTAREHLDVSLQRQYRTHISVCLFIETSVPCQLPQYSEYVLGQKTKTRRPLHRLSLCTQPLMRGTEPQHKPKTPEGAGLSPVLRAHPRRGQARLPSTSPAMAMKRVAPNEISRPKINSHTSTTIQWGFNYPRTHASKILI